MEQEINVIQERQEQEINVLQEQQERSIPILPENITISSGITELFYVIFNETLTHADKTSAEIYQALQDGLYPVGIYYYNNQYYVTPFIDITATNAVAQVMLGTNINNVAVDAQGNAVQTIIPMASTSDIPTLTSQLTNNSGYITNAVSNLLNYYTTSETYSKDDVYNKAEVQQLISAIPNLKIIIVQTLPQTGEELTIYFVPRNPGELNNIYDEYIWIYPSWEKIGSTDIDLSNYYTKSETYNRQEIDAKIVYDASYIFETSTLTQTQYTDLVNAITNKARIFVRQNSESYDVFGKVYDEQSGDISLTITVGTVQQVQGTDYPIEIIAKFDINGATKEVITTQAYFDGSAIAQSFETLNAEIANKPDIDTDQLENYYTKPINNSFGGFNMPDTTHMTPIKTIEYDTASTDYYKICSYANNSSELADIRGGALFRVTVTGNNINHQFEVFISMKNAVNTYPYVAIRNYPGTTSASGTGIRYLRIFYPKAINNGSDWDFEFQTYNSAARHFKIEVFRADNKFTFYETPTTTTLDTDTQNGGSTSLYTTDGFWEIGNNINVNVNAAISANYISSYLGKFVSGTLPKSGQVISAQQMVFLSTDNKFYPSSNKTKPIRTGVGLQLCSNNVNANAAVSSTALRQKYNNATLTHIPHATLTAGDECWFRCTMDANGNILSDNYVDTQMSAGYTWYFIGIATSATAINHDTTQSMFFTLDANGTLTHINGLPLAVNGNGVSY